jgi:phage pi2 protein 07
MSQQSLSVQLSIPVPEGSVLISKVELQELRRNELVGVYWNMKDLEKRINRSNEWIKEFILLPPRFRKILDVEHGGFVYYPKQRGQVWTFQAAKMAQFLDQRFHQIFS